MHEFIDKRPKINVEHYKQEALATHLLPQVDRLYLKQNWIFQKDLRRRVDLKQHKHGDEGKTTL